MKHSVAAAIGFAAILGASSCTNAPAQQTPAASPGIVASSATEDVAATISQLEKDWVAAISKKDPDALGRLLADDFVGTSPTAHTFTKTHAIADLKSSKYAVEKMDLDEVSVNVYGNTAVSFTSQEEKSQYAGNDTSGHYHFTDVWVKRDGRWQVVASHGSRYESPAAGEKSN
jgi:ketosteroid isomerase-like protein